MISRHTYTLTVDVAGTPTVLAPLQRSTLTLDDGWAPYIQADVTVAADAATYAALDPRDDARAQLTLTRTPGTSITVDLGVRERERTPEGDVRLVLAGDEALAQDRANLEGFLSGTYPVVSGFVDAYLSLIGVNLTAPFPLDGMAEPVQYIYQGDNIWDAIDTVVQQAGMRLYVDETRQWLLAKTPVIVPGVIRLGSSPVLQEVTDTVSRDDDNWADSVVVRYSWTDMAGDASTATDSAVARLAPTKTKVVDHAFPYPGPGAAQHVLTRALARGRAIASRAVSDYSVRPGMQVILDLPDGSHVGRVEAVTWSLDDDRMTITPRDLELAHQYAWALLAPGESWADSAPGIPWTTP